MRRNLEFGDDESAQRLATVLAEGQPVLRVSALLLRQWYTKYHPDSGPLRYATADALEEALGEEMRVAYHGLGYRSLQIALGKRRKAVLVSAQTCRAWVGRRCERGRVAFVGSRLLLLASRPSLALLLADMSFFQRCFRAQEEPLVTTPIRDRFGMRRQTPWKRHWARRCVQHIMDLDTGPCR